MGICGDSHGNSHRFPFPRQPRIRNSQISIAYTLSINEYLITKAFAYNKEISLDQINKLIDIRQLEVLFEKVEHFEEPSLPDFKTIEEQISNATNQLRVVACSIEEEFEVENISTIKSVNDSTTNSKILPHLQFIINQLENILVSKNNRRYNLITLVMALKCQLVSPACYRYLQSLDYVSFPHHSTLQRLYSNIGLDSEFVSYLKQSTLEFNPMERNVIVQMDEVHVKSEYTYKGGKIIGSSMHSDDPARTVFAIMVSSLYKKWSTIVRLLPCSKSSAKEIFPIIKTIIGDIENCNLKVQVICTDNYPMNVALFKLFSPTSTLDTVVPHPLNSERWIVLLFDFVHILKSIRNN